jgi:2-polyprenyl-3-methyl-5-hydroxy-6-metoxy-1,4-benzoquinol methylase
MKDMLCRFCGSPITLTFADLGVSPLANSFITHEQSLAMEPFYPLHAYVCAKCWLVQLEEFQTPEHIFSEYLYFSSFSDTWLEHCRTYAALMVTRFGFNQTSRIIEIASNDGCLLQFFKQRGIPVLGIEPAANVARTAIKNGVATEIAFFGSGIATRLAAEGQLADLIVANNVLAHVPDLNNFVSGLRILLASKGVITVEFPDLLRLIEETQFDTIYHEHFSYFSFLVVEKIFKSHGLTIFDVEELAVHGGSLRIYAQRSDDSLHAISPAVFRLREREIHNGLDKLDVYSRFTNQVIEVKLSFLEFLIAAKRSGKKVVAYGAPAKGNTLLNYCGIGPEMIEFTVDRSPHKQGLMLPGSRIPIRHPDAIAEVKPDVVVILPWNLADEIIGQMSVIRSWGGRFVVPIPKVSIVP